MNFRLRFALLFTVFVAIILFISFTTVYVLYANYREDNFYTRVKTEGEEFYDFVTRMPNSPQQATALKIIQGLHNNTLYDEQLVVLDSVGNIIDKLPDTLHFSTNLTYLKKVKQLDEFRYVVDKRQYVANYFPETNSYVIASGWDVFGLKKLANLKYILLLVFICGLLVTGVFSFIFVNQAFRPLRRLSMQMQKTNALNLTERLPEGKAKDELQQIAAHFNEMLSRLNQTFQAQKSFVQHASHELRTPLATMLSQTEAALNKSNIGEVDFKKLLISLKEEQLELIELTNSLLLLSQYEKLQPTQWPLLRVDEIIFDAIATAKKIFPDAVINFQFQNQAPQEKDLLLPLNDALMKAAFTNLIKNAVLYSFDKKVFIYYHFTPQEVFIHFENKGELLSTTDVEKLMTPFFRGRNAIKLKGFGLGLSIVKRIVEIHNGQLTYNSQEPNTNRFTISFLI